MTDVRHTVCRGRSVVKCELGLALVLLYALFKYVVFFPEFTHFFFAGSKIILSVNFVKHNTISYILEYYKYTHNIIALVLYIVKKFFS